MSIQEHKIWEQKQLALLANFHKAKQELLGNAAPVRYTNASYTNSK